MYDRALAFASGHAYGLGKAARRGRSEILSKPANCRFFCQANPTTLKWFG